MFSRGTRCSGAILISPAWRTQGMHPKSNREVLQETRILVAFQVMEHRCKHDLLSDHCGFCQVPSAETLGPLNSQELVAWLGKFARPGQQDASPATSSFRTESPQPRASASSTA